jgi:hypothetical protein
MTKRTTAIIIGILALAALGIVLLKMQTLFQ